MATPVPVEQLGTLDTDRRTIHLDTVLEQSAGRVVVVIRPLMVGGKTQPLPPELVGPDGRPNDMYRAYVRYQQEHVKAREAYADAHAAAFADPRTAARWPIDGVALQSAMDRAMTDWQTLGHKTEVESLLSPPCGP